MDVSRLSPSGRAFCILVLAGLWLPMVHLGSSRMSSIRRRSNPDEHEGGGSTNLKVRPCNSKTCIHGSCTSNDMCICYYGFKGPSCDKELSCSSKTCIYGVCSLNDTCTCNHGFKGPTCNEVGFCTSNTCIHGSCLSSGTCSCNNEFTGPSCNEALSSEEPIWMPFITVLLQVSVFCLIGCFAKDICCCLSQKGEAETNSATDRVSGDIAVISTGK